MPARIFLAALVCLGAGSLQAADDSNPRKQTLSIVPCTIESGNCQGKPKDLKRAAEAYWRGYKVKDKDHAQAFQRFSEAAELIPGNLDYVNAREQARSMLVQDHMQEGNRLLGIAEQARAVKEFKTAMELDPTNLFAKQRLMDALGDDAPKLTPGLKLAAQSDPVDLKPRPGKQEFHFRGDSRALYETLARSFGLKVLFDESFAPKQVRFDVDGLNFYKAMELAGMVSKAFWVPIAEDQFFVATDSTENRRQFERMSLRSFYVTGTTTAQEVNDVVSLLRSVFDIRLISSNAAQNMITIRAPRQTLESASEFIKQFSEGPPQVMLDVEAFEVDHMVLRNLGVQMPTQFQMISLAGVGSLLAGIPNIQDLINQLIATGGINQANTTAISTLLAQLQSQQQGPLSSLLSTPFFTFGKGQTLFAVTLPPVSGTFSLNSSNVRSLTHMTLRAMQGKAATMKVGSRFPILNATFAPIFNSGAVAQSIQNNSFTTFPSVSYEDLGLMVKATPAVHTDTDVTLELEMEIKALTGQALNGVPVISNRSYKSTITLKNGETTVVLGYINRTEQVSLSGWPGIGQIPDLGLIASSQNKTTEDDELMIVITPHILDVAREEPPALWMPVGK